MTEPRLSVYIPVHNEEKHLDACLATLGFADEVIVLLDKCTDGSKAIAEKHGVTIIEGCWESEGERRNTGMQACTGTWILDVDADERIPPELGRAIRQVIAASTADLHCIPFDNYIGERLVKHGWGAYIGVSQKIALYRKGAKSYTPDRVTHGNVIIKGRFGQVLPYGITHYMDDSLSDTLRRFDRYTNARAKELVAEGNIETAARNMRRMFSRFYKCYIRRHGYKEGAMGFFVAMLGALYPLVSYLKARDMQPR